MRRGDPKVAEEIELYSEYLKTIGIHSWAELKRLSKAERRQLWISFQRQRWGFEHYFGDDCTGSDGPGHAFQLLSSWDSKSELTLYGGIP